MVAAEKLTASIESHLRNVTRVESTLSGEIQGGSGRSLSVITNHHGEELGIDIRVFSIQKRDMRQ